jgi:hypothetical protein
LCTVGIVGWTAGGECARGRGRVVNGWGRVGGEGEDMGREWMRSDRRVAGRRTMDCSTRKGGGSEGAKNQDKKILMVKLTIKKKTGTATTKSSVC